MKKSYLFAAIIIFIVIFCSSCAERKPRLTFMVGGAPDEIVYLEKLTKEFEEKSNIKVRIIRQPTDSDQRRQGLVVPLKAGRNDPDIFLMDVIWIGQFVASGWLEPIDPYISKSRFTVKPFFKRVVDFADRYDGKLFALPVYVDGGLLYYRRDLLAKYGYGGPPKTWNDLVEYSLKVQRGEREENPSFYGFVWQGAQYEGLMCTFLEFAASNNGGVVVEGNQIKVNSYNNVNALEFMKNLIHKYKISPPNTFTEMKEEEVRSFFQRGDALFERNWPYAWKLHEENDSPVRGNVGIAPLPYFKGGKSAAALGGWHIGISKYSDMKDEAWEFMKFLCSYETQMRLAINLGWNPGRRDVYDDELVTNKLPHLIRLKEVFDNAVARPNLPYYTQVSEVLQRYVNAGISDAVSPKRALDRAQGVLINIIDMYHEE